MMWKQITKMQAIALPLFVSLGCNVETANNTQSNLQQAKEDDGIFMSITGEAAIPAVLTELLREKKEEETRQKYSQLTDDQRELLTNTDAKKKCDVLAEKNNWATIDKVNCNANIKEAKEDSNMAFFEHPEEDWNKRAVTVVNEPFEGVSGFGTYIKAKPVSVSAADATGSVIPDSSLWCFIPKGKYELQKKPEIVNGHAKILLKDTSRLIGCEGLFENEEAYVFEKHIESEELKPNVCQCKPAEGLFTSLFGWRWGRMHKGIDIAGPIGTAIRATENGIFDPNHKAGSWLADFGKTIIMAHDKKTATGENQISLYAHLNRTEKIEGGAIECGEKIADMGNTGRSTGPHLHFEIREGKELAEVAQPSINFIARLWKKGTKGSCK